MQSGKFRRKLQEEVPNERRVFKPFINIFIGGCLVLLAGCATADNSHPSQSAVVKPVEKSKVVFRVAAITDYLATTNPMYQPFVARIGRMDDHEPVGTLSSADDAWQELGGIPDHLGWGYVELKPGLYYLQIKPTFRNVTVGKVDPYPNHSYFFNVPAGKPVVYAGTFGYVVTDVKEGNWKRKRFWGTMHVHYEELAVTNEMDAARQAVGDAWAKVIEPVFPLDYDNLSVAPGSLTNRQIAGIETGPSAMLTNDDVGADITGMVAGPVAAPLAVFGMGAFAIAKAGAQQSSEDGEAELTLAAAGLVSLAVAMPVVYAVDKTFGEAERKKWAPYTAALAKEFATFSLPQQLVNETSNQLSSVHPADENTNQMIAGPGLVIRLQPYRVLLRETRYKKFALEIGVRAVLIDPNLERPLWQHDYVYSDAKTARSNPSFLPAYETLVNAQSEPHTLEDYENASGGKLLHEQLTEAVAAISRDVAGKFRDAGFYR
jgi:hypothetical protein